MITILARIYASDMGRVPNTDPSIEMDVEEYLRSGTKPLLFRVNGKTIFQWISEGYAVDFLAYNTRIQQVVSVKKLRKRWLDCLCTEEEECPGDPNRFGLVEHIWAQKISGGTEDPGRMVPCFVVD
jgi:hypothetical protein